MLWSLVLLVVNAVGFSLFFVMMAGRLDRTVHGFCVLYLFLLGFGTLVYLFIRFLFRFPIPGKSDRPGLRGLGIRIRESIMHTLAWSTVGTFHLMAVEGEHGLVVGAILLTCSSLLFIRLCHRYARWRSLCLRRESADRDGRG